MRIWQPSVTLEMMSKRGEKTMLDFLDIKFVEMGDDYLVCSKPVNEKTRQPLGIMHGGASCVLAESVGSTAANFCVDYNLQYCVGLDINTNHIKSIREGLVFGTARPYHLGRSTQVWGIEIVDENKKLISVNRLTMAVLDRKK